VVAVPPTSRVSTPEPVVASTAFCSRAASSASPKCSSISAPDRMVPIGLATPCPAMSGAEPCTGSNMLGKRRSGL
jgi:hypothetical protein